MLFSHLYRLAIDPNHLLIEILCMSNIRVPWAVLDQVPKLLACIALLSLGPRMVSITILIVFFFFANMLSEKTSRCIDLGLTAAPPHSSTPLRPVGTARPVVVFAFSILLIANLTRFLLEVDVFSVSQFRYFVIQNTYLRFERLQRPILLLAFLLERDNLSI